MTGVKVVDASALAAILFADPEAEAMAERLDGARLAAPTLLDHESANVCLTKIRRQPNEREAIRAAFRLAHRLNVKTVAVENNMHVKGGDLLVQIDPEPFDAALAEAKAKNERAQGDYLRDRGLAATRVLSVQDLAHAQDDAEAAEAELRIAELNRRYTHVFTEVFKDGVASGEFRGGVSAALIRDLVFGGIDHHISGFLFGQAKLDIDHSTNAFMNVLRLVIGKAEVEPPALDRIEHAVARIEAVADKFETKRMQRR